jgi:hypothetical protein
MGETSRQAGKALNIAMLDSSFSRERDIR